jgi:CRP-like cAMP-binding protein
LPAQVLATLRKVGPTLHVRDDEMEAVAARMHIERWAAGEVVQHDGVVPDALRLVLRGRVALYVRSAQGDLRPAGELAPGEPLGITALLRQSSLTTARAIDELEVLVAPIDLVEDLARTHPALARDLGREIDNRRERVRAALGERRDDTTPTSTTLADHGQN